MVWKNGEIDKREFVIFHTGYNKTDGDWYWGLTPATYARHLELVRIAYNRTGRVLSPGEGWSTYRPLFAQKIARNLYGNGAAWPGTSSHGGYWENQETLAIDYSNWAWVYGGDRGAFYADCRKAGLTPGMIEPSRGYPDEPWHVIDKNPHTMPAFAVGTVTPIKQNGFLMALSDSEQAEVLNNTRQLYNAFFQGGPSMGDSGRSASFSFGNMTEFLDRIDQRVLSLYQANFSGGESMPDGGKSLGQSLADLRTEIAEVRALIEENSK